MTFSTEVDIEARPERVYQAFSDIDSWPRWMPNLVGVERLTDGPFGVGAEWRETRKLFGQEASEVFEVTAADPPSRLRLRVDGSRGSSKKGEYRFDYRFEPSHEGTRLRLEAEVEIPGVFAKLFGPLFVQTLRKACERDHQALKGHVESAW